MTFSVNAVVVDLRNDQPRNTDKFLIDSNVLYWFGYTRSTQDPKLGQSRITLIGEYTKYINIAIKLKSVLYKATLSFAEVAHIIEGTERRIFSKKQGLKTEIETKRFRHDYPTSRQGVVIEIQNTWSMIDSITKNNTLDVTVDTPLITKSLQRIQTEAVDGYDCFMIEALLASGITQVITDDADFGQVAGLTIFTANNKLLTEAHNQNKLIQR